MVVIGHSQGGLLTKMMAIHSGDRLFAAASRRPLDELVLSDETRDLLKRSLFVEPLPFVERVVFIATPHRGSFLTLNQLAAWVTRFVKLPLNLVRALGEVVTKNREALTATGVVPTSVDNMNPRHHFIRALQDIPIAPAFTRTRSSRSRERGRSRMATMASSSIRARTSRAWSPSW